MSKPLLSLIVALTQNGVIGRDNGMPWHLPTDLQRFKTISWGKPVMMGRKTYTSIGRPLPGRTNIVITRSDNFMPDEAVMVANSFAQAQDLAQIQARRECVDEVFVIGGAEIFKLALAEADRLYMTEILASLEGDTFFPAFAPQEWQETRREGPVQGEKDSHSMCFVVYERIVSAHENPKG